MTRGPDNEGEFVWPERSRGALAQSQRRAPRLCSGRTIALVISSLSFATPALADSLLPAARWANVQLPDPEKERQAKALMETIRCLVCQGQSIADSDAEMAGDMRSLIRERINRGEEAESIRSWLISRYGDYVSFRPSSPFLWVLPFLLLAGGMWLARGRFRRRGGKSAR